MPLTVADLTAKLGLDTSGFDRGMGGVTTHRGWDDIGRKTADTGKKMTMGLTLPIVAVGAVAVTMAANFETSMNQVQAASGASAEEMKGLSDYAMKMGADTMFSAGEAGKAMLDLSKGGMTAAQIKAGGLAASLDLAAAGDLELAQAAEVTIQAMGMFSLKASEAGAVADALAGGANASTASVEDLALAFSQVGPGAKTAGLSLQETVSVLAAFADKGIKGSDAGTSLKTMLANLVPHTDKARHMFDQLGISFTKADGSFKSISEIAQILQDKMGGLSAAERTAAMSTLFGSDATRAATILMESGAKGLEKYTKATNDKNAADKMADARTKGLAGAVESLKGSLETVAISLSQVAIPMMTDLAKTITGVVNKFMGLSDTQKKWILIAAGTAAAAGPVLIGLGKVAQGVVVAEKMYLGLRKAILGVTAAQGALGATKGAGVVGAASGATAGVGPALAGLATLIPVAAIAAGVAGALVLGVRAGLKQAKADKAAQLSFWEDFWKTSGAMATSGGDWFKNLVDKLAGDGTEAAEKAVKAAKAAFAPIVQRLSVKMDDASYGEFRKLYAAVDAVKALAAKGIVLNLKNLGEQGPGALNALRDTMMSSLHITARQAEAILNTMAGKKLSFDWDKQTGREGKKVEATVTSTGGKIVSDLLAAGDKAGKGLAAGLNHGQGPTKAAAAKLKEETSKPVSLVPGFLTRFGEEGGRGLAKGLKSGTGPTRQSASSLTSIVSTAFQDIVGKVGDFVNQIIRIVNVLPGVSINRVSWGKGSPLSGPTPLAQGTARVNKPTFALIGEDGPEAVLPLSKPGRMKAILSELGLMSSSPITGMTMMGQKPPLLGGIPAFGEGGIVGDIKGFFGDLYGDMRGAIGAIGGMIDNLSIPKLPDMLAGFLPSILSTVWASVKGQFQDSFGKRPQIVRNATEHIGDPYVWGGTSPGGFDCSGLVQHAYAQAGIAIPRIPVNGGRVIGASQVLPADVLLYNPGAIQEGVRVPFGHYRMFAGDGKTIESGGGGVHMDSLAANPPSQIRTYLARGGITTGPSIVGEGGPARPEAVIPLTNPSRGAAVMREAGLLPGGEGAAPVIHEHFHIHPPGGTAVIGSAEDVVRMTAPYMARAHEEAAAARARSR